MLVHYECMEYKVTEAAPSFVPVKVEITLNTQNELDAFHAIANNGMLGNVIAKTFDGVSFDWWDDPVLRERHTEDASHRFYNALLKEVNSR